MNGPVKFVVIQDGARLHYAVPAAMERQGILERVYTNWYSAPMRMDLLLARLIGIVKPQEGKRLRARFSADLPASKVVSSPWHALRAKRARKRFPSDELFYQWEADEFARWVEREGFGQGDGLFGFVRNISPRLARRAKEMGLFLVVDQMIAPRAVELREERIQHERFPGWGTTPMPAASDLFVEMEQETWQQADLITCASEYVREGLLEAGIDARRMAVIPYPVDTRQFPFVDRRKRTGPIRVGFVGAVGLRKGTPYFFEVAKRLAGENMRFEMVGPIHLSAAGQEHRGAVTLRGSVPRVEIPAIMAEFDVFLFPSTCEGSAQALSEALATGLPVICSKNSGSPDSATNAAHRLRYDDIGTYCGHIAEWSDRREYPASASPLPNLQTYGDLLVRKLSHA